MPKKSKVKCIGVLTSGGDCPGLNAAIRGIVKPAIHEYGIRVVGIHDGFRGLVERRTIELTDKLVSGILTRGGTILGTSRDKPHKMPMGDKVMDMTSTAVANAEKLHLDALVCLGGGGTQKNALRLQKAGLPVVTLPKTIDNDVVETDVTFGFDTARNIVTGAIDRLHTTATSHHRIIVCEIMGHKAGWLALEAGMAGGADVIMIPELPYDLEKVGEYLLERRRSGKRFSIIAVAEGAMSKKEIWAAEKSKKAKNKNKKSSKKTNEKLLPAEPWHDETREGLPIVVRRIQNEELVYHVVQEPKAVRIARQLQELTGTEARVTSLGHVQRGGVPSSFDRMLCTRLGARAAQLMASGVTNVMVGYRNGICDSVELEKVAGQRKTVSTDHPMLESARLVGTCFGD